MEITKKLRERFCKDYDIPIKLFKEPYFTDRLNLFNKQFDTLRKWKIFVDEVDTFNSEQDYFEYYNKVKDNFINNIKSKAEYQEFNNYDMNKFKVPNYQIGRKTVFTHDNIGKTLVSIDLTKANYSALKFFNPNIVDNTKTYGELISKFTNLKHIIESKYIRQVVFGNCNPSRQVTIEKYMMNYVMEIVLKYVDTKYVQTYMNDEIVFELTNDYRLIDLLSAVDKTVEQYGFNVHAEVYKLSKIPNTDFYVKKFLDGSYEFKCANSLFYPFIIRAYNGEEIQENDLIFYHEGYLSKFVEIPKIEVV